VEFNGITVSISETAAVNTMGLSEETTFEGFIAEMIGFQANQKADYANRLSFQEQLFTTLENRFTDESMVNIDEELASLVELQSAFTASARVLTTVQRALDELLGVIN
jgi:flagellar hook-associated protein 1 FlgK